MNDTYYPGLQAAWNNVLSLYDDSLVDLAPDVNRDVLEREFCKEKLGDEREHCIRIIRMTAALEAHITKCSESMFNSALWDKSPIIAKYPNVRTSLDDDGLIGLDAFARYDSDKLQYGNDYVFYHPALNYHFVRRFKRFVDGNNQCVGKIAVDPRRMVSVHEYPVRLLEAYWYGPHFNLEDIDDQIHGMVFTVHSRLPDSKRNMLNKLDRTEFMWSMKGKYKTLQIEEIVPIGVDHPHFVSVRYIHTMRDVERHAFIHLDGAMRSYTPEGYMSRYRSKLTSHPEPDQRFKLFRVDGDIRDQEWVDLIADFYAGNELIHEYFGQPMTE